MPLNPDPSITPALIHARFALGLTQGQLGESLGASRRTAARWEAGQSQPTPAQVEKLTRMLHPKDRAMAAKMAAHIGTTLEALGLPGPAGVPVARPFAVRLLVDAVVCAAAEALDTSPPAARAALRAAFGRARAMGLSLEEVDDGLSPPAPSPQPSPAQRGKFSAVIPSRRRGTP